MEQKSDKIHFDIPAEILKVWQNTVDIMAELINVPAALIMKTDRTHIEVFRSSRTKGNPYHPGERTPLDGLYCETVIKTKKKLLVPNALKSKKWKYNPDIKLGMISYLGFPILWPDQEPFGTLCVLDSKENAFSQEAEKLMKQFKEIIEGHLGLLYTRQQLEAEVRKRKESEKALEESENKFKSITEYATDGILMVDSDYHLIYVNQKLCKITGYNESELIGRDFRTLLDKTSLLLVAERYTKRQRGEEVPSSYEFHIITKDGQKRLLEASSTIIKNKHQNVQTIAHIRDITNRKKTEEALRKERNQLEELHKAVDLLQKCDTEEELYRKALQVTGNILQFDYCTIYSVEGKKLIPKAFTLEAFPEGSKPHHLDDGIAGLTLRKEKSFRGEDLKKWKEANPSRDDIKSFMSIPIGKKGVLQAFSKQKGTFSQQDLNLANIFAGHLREEIARFRLEKKLREEAIHDPLTGLFNRRFFNQSIKKELARCKRYNSSFGFLMIDVNRFKEINDKYSHLTGDKVLKEVAELLKKNVRDADTVVRYGGDEFLIMLPETDGDAKTIIQRISKKVEEWNQEHKFFDFPLTLAIGSSHWDPKAGKNLEEVLKKADLNMYKDKKNFKKRK